MILPLTEREMAILMMIADGMTNDDMAEELFISIHTVRSHAKHMLAAFGARNRAQAVAMAYHEGLLKPKVHA